MRQIEKDDEFKDRVLKLIPSEIVLAYITLRPIIEDANINGLDSKEKSVSNMVYWVVVVFLTVLTPFYLKKFQKVTDVKQIGATTIGFLVWVYTLGGSFLDNFGRKFLQEGKGEEFVGYDLHYSWAASVIMILWSLAVPLWLDKSGEEL